MARPRTPELPSLAVVVPALDEAEHLPGLLASLGLSGDGPAAGAAADVVLAEDVPDETIVVDGMSHDGTADIACRFGARVVRSRPGRGLQLAAGARAAAADLLLFLHADCRVERGSLARVRRAFLDPDVVATGMSQTIDGKGPIFRAIERTADLRVRLGVVYGDSGLGVRRSDYEAVGGFRDLPVFEDLDLSRRLRRRGDVRLVSGTRLHVSARRWRREGVLRRTVRNWMLTLAWRAGMDPVRLARFYPPHARSRRSLESGEHPQGLR